VTEDLPAPLARIVEDFAALGVPDRLQLLLELAEGLPELPARYADHPDLLEPVPECQSPVFLAVEVGESGGDGAPGPDDVVHLFLTAPRESPTTRGFAGILAEGLEGLTAREVLAVPDDVPNRLGLTQAVSPLRLRGMAGMLGRIKRQVRERTAA
jgi:cysteine desulfuration protein SufE